MYGQFRSCGGDGFSASARGTCCRDKTKLPAVSHPSAWFQVIPAAAGSTPFRPGLQHVPATHLPLPGL